MCLPCRRTILPATQPTPRHNITVVSGSTGSGTSTGTSTSKSTTGTSSTSTTGYPVPPSSAVVYTNVQNTKNTGSCDTSGCAARGQAADRRGIAFNQTSPSLSGSSTEVYNSGIGFDSLWYWHLGAEDAVTNIELDFYLMVDGGSTTTTQAMENGPQQYVGGYKYSMTMQCEDANQIWRVWISRQKGGKQLQCVPEMDAKRLASRADVYYDESRESRRDLPDVGCQIGDSHPAGPHLWCD